MIQCSSCYTVRRGELIECRLDEGDHGNLHEGYYDGFLWTWSTADADR